VESRQLIAFFGHHKSGTRWVGLVLESLASAAGLRWQCVSNAKWFGYDLQRYVDEHAIDVLSYTNAEIRYVEQLRRFRGFHVIRDPRDMLVSAYFSHRESHGTEYWPELVAHRVRLTELSQPAGLLCDLQFTVRLPTDGYELRPFDAMAAWDYGRPDVLELRFEQLVADPVGSFAAAVEFVGLPASREEVARAVKAHTFETLSGGRKPGEVREGHHYRSGVPGDWRRFLEVRHVAALARETGDLAARLGY
jgi:Sulfotransferase domain